MRGVPQSGNAKSTRKRYDLRENLRFRMLRIGLWLVEISGDRSAIPYFPAESKLDPVKRVEMDYQAELKRREIRLDKLIFGVLVAALTALATGGTLYLVENHREADTHQLEIEKLNAAHQQFLMSERRKALGDVAAAMSAVSRVFFDYTKEKKTAAKEEANKAYSETLSKAQLAIDQAEILLPPGIRADLERYYQIHKKISLIGVQKCGDYRPFLMSISRQFDHLCYVVLVTKDSAEFQKKLEKPQMTLADIEPEKRDLMTDQKYLDIHRDYWKQHQNEAIDPLAPKK
jgi:hypothetical protein